MTNEQWQVWPREWMRYKVALRIFSNFAGSGYSYARKNGRVLRFWTKKAAQAHADKLNSEAKA